MQALIGDHGLTQRQACLGVGLARSTAQYTKRPPDDTMIISALDELTTKHTAIGVWQCHHRMRLMGHAWNFKRVYRVYTGMGLNIRRRPKKRLPARVKQALFQPGSPDQVWSIDFMHDSLWDGRTYRLLNILDDYNREVLAIEVDTSLPAQRVIRVLERLKEQRRLPAMIRVDNGPEFISAKLDHWCREHKITLAYIEPGEPTQTPMWNASMAASVANSSTSTSSAHSMKCACALPSGCTTTTIFVLTKHSVTGRLCSSNPDP